MNLPMNTFSGTRAVNRFSMLRFLKQAVVVVMLTAGVQLSHGFALLGPFEPYQIPALGYDPVYTSFFQFGGSVSLGDIGGPQNIGEGFRRNTPVLYYSCDAAFWNYFGSNGVAAVDQAFGIMNTLTNVSAYNSDLSEFPLQSQQFNSTAQNLYLTDVKSTTLHLLVEQMGLAQPERFTWTLRARATTAIPCPVGNLYLVIKRNYDIQQTPLNQTMYSSYVNGTLYTYGLLEFCAGTPLALTLPYSVDPLGDTYSSVAANTRPQLSSTGIPAINFGGTGLKVGGYYTYLTRDDMGGLRYLLRADNYATEAAGANTVQFVTNNTPVALTNLFDLGLFSAQQATNSAAALQALYPGLIVDDTTNWFALGYTTNISLVVTTSPFWPAGSISVIAVTNRDPVLITFFGHNFGNIITNSYSRITTYRTQTVSPGTTPFVPAGSPVTLVTNTSKPITVNTVAGSFYLLPTNLCAIKVLATLFTNVVATTNLVSTVVIAGDTNQTATFSTITYFTNNWLVYLPVTCPPNTISTRQGIERIHFQRRDFDSLIGTFWAPATNLYTLTALTNNALQAQTIQRVVTRPDFLFTAQDQAGANTFNGTVLRNINYSTNNPVNNGPGTITTPTLISFNKIGDSYWNFYNLNTAESSFPGFISNEAAQLQGLVWASFDGTTNDPVVYPNGTSLAGFISQLFIRISNQPAAVVTNGVAQLSAANNLPYTNTFSVTGGVPPYSWSLAPASPGLPGGLQFANATAAGDSIQLTSGAGVLSAPPAPYDFTIRVTDSTSRYVDVPYLLTIHP